MELSFTIINTVNKSKFVDFVSSSKLKVALTSVRNSHRRVVVTGLGALTPLAVGVQRSWQRLCEGHSGVVTIPEAFDGHDESLWASLPTRIAGLVPRGSRSEGKLDPGQLAKAGRRGVSLGMLYGLIAAEEAVQDSGIYQDDARVGVSVGLAMVDVDHIARAQDLVNQNKGRRINPYFIPHILPNLCSGHIAIKYGFRGPSHSVSTACATGSHAIGDSYRLIQSGSADAMVCGGAEACINPLIIAGFSSARALSTKFNNEPVRASRPFDKLRDGFVMAEGAGVLVLEELNRAKSRDANIYAEVLGYGLSGDAYHVTAGREDGEGALAAMQDALRQVDEDRHCDLWLVNAHATSTPKGDIAELQAVQKLLSQLPCNPHITSNKGHVGHLLGAAGSVESIFAIRSLTDGVIPKTLNLEDIDPAMPCAVNLVKDSNICETSSAKSPIAMKNSFGFGGTNVSLLFGAFVP